MYALPNKTQHKLIVKVRGGISQKLDNFTSASASAAATGLSKSSSINPSNNQTSSSSSSLFSKQSSKSLRREAALSGDSAATAECIAELSNLPQPVFHSTSIHGSKQRYHARKQYITPEHNEMIKYVQQSWKGVERDYKKSANNVISNLDLNGGSMSASQNSFGKQKHLNAKKKTLTTSTPLLLSGSYHHSSSGTKDASNSRQDSFQPFDLEAFWGNRILKRLTEEL